MPRPNSHSTQVNTYVPNDLCKAIDHRAQKLSMTRSRYTALILAQWKAAGCPPVTEADEALMRISEIRPEKKPKRPA